MVHPHIPNDLLEQMNIIESNKNFYSLGKGTHKPNSKRSKNLNLSTHNAMKIYQAGVNQSKKKHNSIEYSMGAAAREIMQIIDQQQCNLITTSSSKQSSKPGRKEFASPRAQARFRQSSTREGNSPQKIV